MHDFLNRLLGCFLKDAFQQNLLKDTPCTARNSVNAGECRDTSQKEPLPLTQLAFGDQSGGASLQRPISSEEFEASAAMVAAEMQTWKQGRYVFVKTLQDAKRNHGRVDLMESPEGGCKVAAKRMPNRWMTEHPRNFAASYPKSSEQPWLDLGIVRQLNRLSFPYVCELMGVFRDDEHTYVISTFATLGDLFTWTDQVKAVGIPREEEMRPIVKQIFTGVCWLHDAGVAHRDLSLENILLTKSSDRETPDVKIIDFGMATFSRWCKEVRGKQSYQAPEMHLGTGYDPTISDAFALGVIFFSMAAQDYPWMGTNKGACRQFTYVSENGFKEFIQKRRLRTRKHMTLSEAFTEEFAVLLESLLCFSPGDRGNLGERGLAQYQSVWEMRWLQSKQSAADEILDTHQRLVGG